MVAIGVETAFFILGGIISTTILVPLTGKGKKPEEKQED